MEQVSPTPPERILASLTRLVSRWNSLELQRRITEACGVSLDLVAMRAVYTLGLRGGTARPSTIADEVHLTRPSTSKLITRLIDAGLVSHSPDATDGRSVIVELTGQGRRAYESLAEAGVSMVSHSLEGWDARDAERLASLLDRFIGVLATEETLVSVEEEQAGHEAMPASA